jgi:hypothetical protein
MALGSKGKTALNVGKKYLPLGYSIRMYLPVECVRILELMY